MPARILRCRPALLAVLVAGAAALFPAAAHATSPFPVTESFTGSSLGSAWHMGGSATLTAPSIDPAGNGWLRLTSATGNEFGYVINDTPFPSANGIDVTFQYASYGGSGADGLTFFLYDGSTPASSFAPGPAGGSLGYASCPSSGVAGLTNGYAGVGFDEWGNFANTGFCGQDGYASGLQANRVTVRGGAATNYQYLTSVPTLESLTGGSRSDARTVNVAVTPDMKLTVYITYPDGRVQTVTSGYQLPTAPASLKFGWVASTGGSTDDHEIRNTTVAEPADLRTTVVSAPTTANHGDPVTYTVQVKNVGQNDVSDAAIDATNVAGSLQDLSWTCTSAAGTCGATLGSGTPATTADLPVGAAATYTITGRPIGSANSASVQFEADPRGETTQSVPGDNVITATTELAPAQTTAPAMTLTNTDGYTGTADATPGTYAGTSLTVTDTWQHCAPDGTGCADIAGATSLTYGTGTADRGYTLRLHEHVSGPAGSLDEYTPAYAPLPGTTQTSTVSAVTSRTSAQFTLGSSTPGVAYECRLDTGSWAPCSATPLLSGLADGTHTFSSRAVDAGLSDPTPPRTTWVVDTTAPAPPAITAPAADSVSSVTRPALAATAEPGSTVTFSVDGAAVGTATADGSGRASLTPPTPLADGPHAVSATATDGAGNVSQAAPTVDWTVKTTTTVQLLGPSAGPTNDADPTVDYRGEPGDAFTIAVDGSPVATGVIGSGGNGSLVLPQALSDGSHTISIAAVDPAGNRASDALTVTVDTTPPRPPVTVGRGPADVTSSRTAAFSFADAQAGVSYQCSLDGAAWAPCPALVEYPSLADGAHILLVRAVDAVGNASAGTEYAWTVKTTPPAAPVILGGPAAATVPSPTSFQMSAAPGTALECSVDGGGFTPCGDVVNLRRLPLGRHSLTVRAVDEAGNISAPTVYHWTVLARRGPAGLARRAKLLVAPTASATGDRSLAIGCALNAGSVRRCAVAAYAHGVRVGTGVVRRARPGDSRSVLSLWFNARGRRLLARAVDGLPLTLRGTVIPFGTHRLPAASSTIVYRPLRFLVPDVLFAFDSSRLTTRAQAVVDGLAAQLRDAATVVCIGNTDAIGSTAYNQGLALRRAQTVCAALRRRGVHARLQVISDGESRPAATNRTAAGRQANRRVILRVTYRAA